MRTTLIPGGSSKIILLLSTIIVLMANAGVQAQSIFLHKRQFGFLALAGYGASDKYDGSVESIGVSLNGFTNISLGFSDLSHDRTNITTLGISPDFLIKKQFINSAVNVQFTPGFAHTIYRSYYYGDGSNNIVSFGMAVSGELNGDPGVHMIPEVHINYEVIFSNGSTNLLTTGLDWNVGIDLSDQIMLVVDPGISFAINENSIAGSIAGGFLIR